MKLTREQKDSLIIAYRRMRGTLPEVMTVENFNREDYEKLQNRRSEEDKATDVDESQVQSSQEEYYLQKGEKYTPWHVYQLFVSLKMINILETHKAYRRKKKHPWILSDARKPIKRTALSTLIS